MYRVLVVEDDPMVAMIHRRYVETNSEFEIAGICGDGESALQFVEENDVDLMIVDVYMPRVGGLELLRQIRARDVPVSVVMITAANDVATVEEAFRLGAEDYLVKPFTFDRFQAALGKFLDRKNALAKVDALDQEELDRIIAAAPGRETPIRVPKGIQEKTIDAIVNVLKGSSRQWLAGDEIAGRVNLSSVTARRYMNFLVKSNVAESRMDYETGGRPRLLYRLKQS